MPTLSHIPKQPRRFDLGLILGWDVPEKAQAAPTPFALSPGVGRPYRPGELAYLGTGPENTEGAALVEQFHAYSV